MNKPIDWQKHFYNLDLSKFNKVAVNRYCHKLNKLYSYQVWRTKDNRLIPTRFMKRSHLVNAYQFIIGKLVVYINNGDRASFAIHEQKYWMLRCECESRGIQVPVHIGIYNFSKKQNAWGKAQPDVGDGSEWEHLF